MNKSIIYKKLPIFNAQKNRREAVSGVYVVVGQIE